MSIVGVLLAGGQSRRFGSPKSFAERKGIPFYQYSMKVMKPICDDIIIVTNPSLEDQFNAESEEAKVVTDIQAFKGQGPLAGILTAMEHVESTWYFILPTDVPFIEEWVVNELIKGIDEKSEVIIPTVQGRDQPLIGLYHHSVKNKIIHLLKQEKRSMRALYETIAVKKLSIDEDRPFRNINRQEDFASDE